MKVTLTAKEVTTWNDDEGYDVQMKEGDEIIEEEVESVEISEESGEMLIDIHTENGGEIMLTLKSWEIYIQK